jgi:colicin import membrane protein
MSRVSVATPVASISKLEIEALPDLSGPALTSGEKHYRDELASRLKLLLKLPEHGAVQLKLTLNRAGKALKVQIVKSVSQANKNYIEKTLPTLVFPAFGSHFENLSEYTFSIQLSNEL